MDKEKSDKPAIPYMGKEIEAKYEELRRLIDEENPTEETRSDLLFFLDFIDKSREVNGFLSRLCQGDLDAQSPDKSNIMAGPLKELQAQLHSLAWSMDQLSNGRMVSKLLYGGRLFQSFNKLVDKVAVLSNSESVDGENVQKGPVNSWRYHQLLSALNNLKIMIIEVTDSGKILHANKPAREYIGSIESFSEEWYTKGRSTLLDYIAGFDVPKNKCPVSEEIFGEDMIWYQITTDRATFVDGSEGYMHVIDNISSWKNKEHSLQQTAETDQLTKVYNRHGGMRSLESTLSPAGKKFNHCAAFIDLDYLKNINDNYGHAEGDRALKIVAEAIVSSVRENDSVSRYGGDEFLIVFNRCSIGAAKSAMDRMNEKIDAINELGEYPYEISFSYGLIEILPQEDVGITDLIVKMDRIMYENKRMKKDSLSRKE